MAVIGADMSSYFAHVSTAREDARMIDLQKEHGFEGYGIYWALIELLRQSIDYEYEFNPDKLAFVLRAEGRAEVIEDIISNTGFGLFEVDTNPGIKYFRSVDLNANMDFMESKRQVYTDGANVTNFKLYGRIPESWKSNKIQEVWNTFTVDEQTKALSKMNADAKSRLEQALNE